MSGGRETQKRPAIPPDRCQIYTGMTYHCFSNKPRHLIKTAAFAVGAVLFCHLAFASAPDERTPGSKDAVQKQVTVKHSRPLYLTLPESVIHVFKYPVQHIRSWFSHDSAKNAGNNKDAVTNSAASAQDLSLGSRAHQRTSMYIGLSPPVPATPDSPPPYRQNAAADTGSCGSADTTYGSSTDGAERDTRGSLLNGLSVGLCMKF
jgi:hypothetical protein